LESSKIYKMPLDQLGRYAQEKGYPLMLSPSSRSLNTKKNPAFLADVKSILKPRGWIAGSVPNRERFLANIELRDGDICRLSTVSQDMDAVITIDVIEHLTSDQLSRAYKEVHKVLKMEGKWFINVPWNEDLKLTEVFCPHCHKTFHRFGHKQSFDEAKLNAILVQANFQVAFIKKIYPANFMLPAPLMWLYRIIARIYLKNYASMFAMAIKDGDKNQSRIKTNSAS